MSDQAAPARNRCREEQPRNGPPGGEGLHSLHCFRCKRSRNLFRISKPTREFGNQSVTGFTIL